MPRRQAPVARQGLHRGGRFGELHPGKPRGVHGFSAVEWRGAGLDGSAVAALWGLGVGAEIVLFALSARLPAFFQPSVMLMIGAGGGLLRWGVMAFDPPAIIAAGTAIAARPDLRRDPSRRG